MRLKARKSCQPWAAPLCVCTPAVRAPLRLLHTPPWRFMTRPTLLQQFGTHGWEESALGSNPNPNPYCRPSVGRLQFIVANAQAEYIVKYLQPHKDFKTLAGYCFAGIKGRIGAAFARALAYRALSCTKDGRRRHHIAYGPRNQAANQHLNLPIAPHSHSAALVSGV